MHFVWEPLLMLQENNMEEPKLETRDPQSECHSVWRGRKGCSWMASQLEWWQDLILIPDILGLIQTSDANKGVVKHYKQFVKSKRSLTIGKETHRSTQLMADKLLPPDGKDYCFKPFPYFANLCVERIWKGGFCTCGVLCRVLWAGGSGRDGEAHV